jgi:hypothetical protein
VNAWNPYAPPAQGAPFAFAQPPSYGYYRDGKTLVLDKRGAELPDRCVVCNAPANGFRLRRALSWHHPALYILFLLSILIYVIVAAIVRKTATIHVGLCEAHQARRRLGMWIGWLGALGGLGLAIAGGANDSPALLVIGLVGFLGALVAAVVLLTPVRPAKIDDHRVWLHVGAPFLDSIPTGDAFPTTFPGYASGPPQAGWPHQPPGAWGPPRGG